MHRYVIKRIVLMIPVLFMALLLVFFILNFIPGNPGRLILGYEASEAAVNQLNEEFGINDPFFTRFFNYLKDVILHFDFGTSYRTQEPVIDEILRKFPYTLTLVFWTMLLGTVIGITMGILSAVKQYSMLDKISTFFAMFLAAIPGFWLGLMLMLVFSVNLELLPTNGADSWVSYILPVITNAAGLTATNLRYTRSTMLEAIRTDYVRTARAKGVPETLVIWKHALKNALLPVVTILGARFGQMLGGSIVVESLFSMPGLGNHVIEAIRAKDIPVVMGSTLFLAALYCIITLGVDLLYAVIDPRIKARYSR